MVSVRCITAPGTRPVRAPLSAPEAAAPARPGLAEERGALSSSFISNGTSSGKSRWWLVTNIAFFFLLFPAVIRITRFLQSISRERGRDRAGAAGEERPRAGLGGGSAHRAPGLREPRPALLLPRRRDGLGNASY